VANDLGGLGVLLVELEAHLLHSIEDAAVDGLEAVAHVGEGAADDDRHGVVEIAAAHLLFNIDGEHDEGAGTRGRGGAVAAASGGRIVGAGVLRGRVVRAEGEQRIVIGFVRHGHLPL